MGGVLDEDGNRVLVSEVPLKPFVTVTSATSVKLSWEMAMNAPYIDFFTVMREPYPRVTALPHYTHGIEVEVEHEYRRKKGGGDDHIQKGTVEIAGLTPGYAYTFVVHSFTENNGHSTESESSDFIELPLETLEAERERRGESAKKKKGLLQTLKENFRRGVDSFKETMSYLLDPAVYPIDEVREHLKKPGAHALLRGVSSKITTYEFDLGNGIKSKASSAAAAGGVLMSDSVGVRDQHKAANAEAVSNDITSVVDWFNKGNWGNGGFFNSMVRLVYSLSEWFAYGSICAALLIKADLFSTLPVIWVLLVALIRNPHPAPEEWNYLYRYSLFVLFFRVMFETNAFCMDVDPKTSRTDLNHWKFSMQPICPSDPINLFNPEAPHQCLDCKDLVDWMYSTKAIVMLTVKHRSSTLLWSVLPDIFVCVSVLLHIDHLQFVGLRTYHDMTYIRPCKDYSRLHGIKDDSTFDDIKARRLALEFEDGYSSTDYDHDGGYKSANATDADAATATDASAANSDDETRSDGAASNSNSNSNPASARKGKAFEEYIGLKGIDDRSLYGIPDYQGRRVMWPHEYYREAVFNQRLGEEKKDAEEKAAGLDGMDSSGADLRTSVLRKIQHSKLNNEKSRASTTEVQIDKKKAVIDASKKFLRDVGSLLQHLVRYAIGAVRDFLTEIQLSNKTEPPSRNTGKPGMDLYPVEFLFQAMGLIWLIMDFSNLNFENLNNEQTSGVEQLQSGLTIAILTSTISIVINRLVYMSQNMLIKYMMQVAYTLTLLLHIFVVLPLTDGRPFVKAIANNHLKAFVSQQLAMLMVSALQIRTGYREGSQHQTLFMKLGTGPVAFWSFTIYQNVPFLFELRTLLDWVMSDSSLDLNMWFRFENIYHMLFKDLLDMEARRMNRPVYSGGRKFPLVLKMLQGFSIFLGIIILLLAPIFLFSSINPVLSSNAVESASLSVDLEVRTNASLSVYTLYQAEAKSIDMASNDISAAETYLMSTPLGHKFDAECLLFPRHSTVSWVLPDGPRNNLAQSLMTHVAREGTALHDTTSDSSAVPIVIPGFDPSTTQSYATLIVKTSFTRFGPPTAKTVSVQSSTNLDVDQTLGLGRMIAGNPGAPTSVTIKEVLPRLVNLPPRNEVIKLSTSDSRVTPNPSDDASVILTLERLDQSGALLIWGMRPNSATLNGTRPGFCGLSAGTNTVSDEGSSEGVLFATFSDRFLSGVVEQLGLSSYSMLALYGFIFVAVGGMVRRHFQFNLVDVMIYEIPNPDYLLRLCKGLRMLRAHRYPGCRRDEVKLFYTLIQMLRSPDILIKVTRNKDV